MGAALAAKTAELATWSSDLAKLRDELQSVHEQAAKAAQTSEAARKQLLLRALSSALCSRSQRALHSRALTVCQALHAWWRTVLLSRLREEWQVPLLSQL